MKPSALHKYYYILIIALLNICASASAQNPDQSIINLWTKKDLKFDSPKTGNPLLPGYFADPTIIENNGTYYIYATSDMPSWNDITRMAVWSSKDFVNWNCDYLNWQLKMLVKAIQEHHLEFGAKCD